ncbi:MAG: SGNH/GDSL hydrolase family protein [Oscillospiraceae bacterium]|nr:SGNH/GDSL hydrolase family protein [Oscillospiraceae bacterium]
MKNKLSGIHNILWAIGILTAALALLVGLVISMSARYDGDRLSGTMTLGEGVRREKRGGSGADNLDAAPADTLRELPSTKKGGLEAVFGMTFLCDKTIVGLRDYAKTYGDGTPASIWTDNGSGFYAATAASKEIIFVDGSMLTPSNAAMITKPDRLVIYLGADGLPDTTEQDFIAGYVELINSIRDASPNTAVICCSIASVSTNYQAADGLTPEHIARANAWIRQVCIQTGAWYADLASLLNDSSGYLSDAYLMPDGRSISAAGIAIIVDYFRFHGLN